MKKTKSLTQTLNEGTGTTPEEREQWRDTIAKLITKARVEKDIPKQREMKSEIIKVFNSFSYWKSNYKTQ